MDKDKVVHTHNINIEVGLAEDRQPLVIKWMASDGPEQSIQEAKAMLLSFFDERTKDTMRIDLWTKDMQVVEMDRLMFHTLKSLADTYFRATQNAEMANDLRRFVEHFGIKTGILEEEK